MSTITGPISVSRKSFQRTYTASSDGKSRRVSANGQATNAVNSYAVVIRHPYFVDRRGNVHKDRVLRGRLEIALVKADSEAGSLYLGQRVKSGFVYFNVRKPPEQNPNYHVYKQDPLTGYREWKTNYDEDPFLPSQNFLVRAGKAPSLTHVKFVDESKLEGLVKQTLEASAIELSSVAKKHLFLSERDSQSRGKQSDEDRSISIFYKMFRGMVRSSKANVIVLDGSQLEDTKDGQSSTMEDDVPDYVNRRRKRYPFAFSFLPLHPENYVTAANWAYVLRRKYIDEPESNTRRNHIRKERANAERRLEDEMMADEGLSDYYAPDPR